jgi:hypothetical protein
VLNDLECSFPVKCSLCRAEIPTESFERQLNAKQLQIWNEFNAQKSLAESERMLKCECCSYFEIRSDTPVLWWCPMCGRGACQVCSKELPAAAPDDASAGVDPARDMLLRPHIVGCATLRDAKEAVDKVRSLLRTVTYAMSCHKLVLSISGLFATAARQLCMAVMVACVC